MEPESESAEEELPQEMEYQEDEMEKLKWRIDIKKKEHKSFEPRKETKILHLVECYNVDMLLEVLQHDKFRNFLKHSSHCFVLIVDIQKDEEDDLNNFGEFEVDDLLERPLIIQLNRAESKTIFFKSSGDEKLECIYDINTEKLNEEEFLGEIKSPESFKFRLLIRFLSSRKADEYYGGFITCNVDLDKEYHGKRLLDYAVDNDDSLSVLFLKLSQPEVYDSNAMKNAVENASLTTLRALLGLPIIDDGKMLQLDNAQVGALGVDYEGESLLCIAAKSSESDVVEFLIKYPYDMSKKEFDYTQKITKGALEAENFENLCLLLENDFPFPADSSELSTILTQEHSKKLSKVYDDRKKFHDAIKAESIDDARKFIEANPKIKIGYSEGNKCALGVALEEGSKTRNFRMYALLLYNRFTAIGDEYKNLYLKLTEDTRKRITIAGQEFYGREVDSHILFIFSKTRLGHVYEKEQEKKNFETIKKFLERLNQITEVVPILKAIEHSHDLSSIVFDFDNTDVKNVDLNASSDSLGVCHHSSGRIYIAANPSDNNVLKTLAHEFTHFALGIVFDNAGLPFRVDDSVKKEAFENIVFECKELGERNPPFIKVVFSSYELKKSEEGDDNGEKFQKKQMAKYCSELIVRIPERYAYRLGPEKLVFENDAEKAQQEKKMLNQKKSLDKDLANYESLKKFYFENVDAEIIKFNENPTRFQGIRGIRQLNDKLGNLREFSSNKIRPVDEKFSDEKTLQLISSQIPEYTISNLIRCLVETAAKDQIVVLSSRDFRNESIYKEVSALSSLCDQTTLIVNHDDGKEFLDQSMDLFLCGDSPKRVYIVFEESSRENFKTVNFNFPFYSVSFRPREITYDWDDLEETTKSELLRTKVKFQGCDILLEEIVNRNSDAAKKLPIALLAKGELKPIGKAVRANNGYDLKYFIKRSLRNSSDSVNFEEFLQQTKEQKLVLITDDAGKGKSTLLSHIALTLKAQFPNHLVIRVDLQNHVEAFKGKSFGNIADLVIALLELDFKKTESEFEKNEREFETALVRDMFKQSRVILLLNAFDEIAFDEVYKENFCVILEQLMASSVKQIFLTMRPYLKKYVNERFKVESWYLDPFSQENQEEFIVRYCRHKLELKEPTEVTVVDARLQQCAEQLIKEVYRAIDKDSSKLMGFPLQVRMVTNIFLEDIKENLSSDTINFKMPEHFNLLWLYQEFMKRRIMNAGSDRGPVLTTLKASNEVKRIDIWSEHEKFAVKYVLPDEAFAKNSSEAETEADLTKLDQRFYKVRMSYDVLESYGIISTDANGQPYFIHQTYAEYFVAMLIVRLSTPELIDISSRKARELVQLLRHTSSDKILDFVESALKNYQTSDHDDLEKEAQKEVQRKVAQSIDRMNIERLMERFDFLCRPDNIFLTNFLLNCFGFCPKEKICKILTKRPWSVVLSRGVKCTIQQYWQLVVDNMEPEKIEEYLGFPGPYGLLRSLGPLFSKTFSSHTDFMRECLTFEQLKSQSLRKFEKTDFGYEDYKRNSIITLMFDNAVEYYKTNLKSEHKSPHASPQDLIFKSLLIDVEERDSAEEKATSEFTQKYFRYILELKSDILKTIEMECFPEHEMSTINIYNLLEYIDKLAKSSSYDADEIEKIIHKWNCEQSWANQIWA